ncbi:MAG: DUF554 domain-containing protein [Mailhella sp.]|jgi:uncharacterized membrane protein YqgA involved in biofilm formation|nr:DUF554 domain-containing protein [Mailhella sp.]
MTGIGTIVNVAAIAAGGMAGLAFGRILPERVRQGLMTACGLCVMFIGMQGALAKALTVADGRIEVRGALMSVGCFALGTLIGEIFNIERAIERFGGWLKDRAGSSRDGGFVSAFVTSSLTVSVGAMAIVGSIADGAMGDPSILFVKAILDFLIIMVMAAALGKGCVFSAVPVAAIQFPVTLLAGVAGASITPAGLDNLSLTGSMIIFCVGVNLVWDVRIRVANMLPVLVVALLWPA